MNKERLTVRYGEEVYCLTKTRCARKCDDCEHMTEMMNKLADYEDLEDQNLLLRLPCEVGDTFYELNECTQPPYVYPRVAHSLKHCVYALERLGKTTFLTQAEAEKKLKELEGK